jgi:hypothetical protein
MMRKILVVAILPVLLAALLAGCSQAMSPPSHSLPASPRASSTTPVSPSAPSNPVVPPATQNDSSSVVQAGLTIKITQPVDGSNLNTGTVTVKGQTAPEATVSVNDQINTADTNGNFSIPLKLADGPNFLDISAIDNNGNRGEMMLMVNVDSSQASSTPGLSGSSGENAGFSPGTIPLIVIAPADGATLNTDNIAVKGQTAPEAGVSVNGQVDIADEQGNFSIAISLGNGLNIINVAASDENGNQVEVILMVNVVTAS